jgi:hypothetical protein
MKKMFNEGNQIHNFMSSSGSGYGSTSQKVTVPVPQHWFLFFIFIFIFFIFAQKREFLGLLQFQEHFWVHPDFKL